MLVFPSLRATLALLRDRADRQLPVVLTPRQYPWLVLAASALLALMVVPWLTTFLPGVTLGLALGELAFIVLNMAAQLGLGYVLRYGRNPLRHWLDRRPLWLNVLLRVGLTLGLMAALGMAVHYWQLRLGFQLEQHSLLNALAGSQIFAFIVLLMQVAVEAVERSRHTATENEALRQQQLEARYEGLKQQLSPHFLFNSLSTLGGLIHETPAAAERFVEELAEVYRYLLQHGARLAVPLGEELDFLRSYYYLLHMRFGERLTLGLDVPAAVLDRPLPPLALQLLVENAVKHNTFTRQRPLQVSIAYQEPDLLLVRNTRQPLPTPPPGSGVGLSNLAARLRLLHHRELQVAPTAAEFVVYVPLPAPLPIPTRP